MGVPRVHVDGGALNTCHNVTRHMITCVCYVYACVCMTVHTLDVEFISNVSASTRAFTRRDARRMCLSLTTMPDLLLQQCATTIACFKVTVAMTAAMFIICDAIRA